MAKPAHFRLGSVSFIYTLRVGFLLFFVCFFTLFCLAGTWQLHRYHYKKELLATQQANSQAPVIAWSNSFQPSQFQRVEVRGHYVNDSTLLLVNRIKKGVQGFNVLTPFHISGNSKLLLVDRGWVAKSDYKMQFASKEMSSEQVIEGYIKFLDEQPFILGKNVLNNQSPPYQIQRIDIEDIQRVTHQDFYPYVLRLDQAQAHGFLREWIVSAVIPERHLGYTIQWFVMAIVLFIAYLCFSCERVKK